MSSKQQQQQQQHQQQQRTNMRKRIDENTTTTITLEDSNNSSRDGSKDAANANNNANKTRRRKKMCRYGPKCRNRATCSFEHEQQQQQQQLTSTESSVPNIALNSGKRNAVRGGRGICKFGNQCTRANCWFDHPDQTTTTTTSVTIVSSQLLPPPQQQQQQRDASLASDNTTTTSTTLLSSTSIPSSSSSSNNILPYRFCSQQECQERQELQQISYFEATLSTSHLPQKQRILDPTLAIARYRRSAAGTPTHYSIQQQQQQQQQQHDNETTTAASTSSPLLDKTILQQVLCHLLIIASTGRHSHITSTPATTTTTTVQDHQDFHSKSEWTEFLVDRLRACQAEATRLFGKWYSQSSSSSSSSLSSLSSPCNVLVPPIWHVQFIRILLWIRYQNFATISLSTSSTTTTTSSAFEFLERTLTAMFSTAMEQYWTTKDIWALTSPLTSPAEIVEQSSKLPCNDIEKHNDNQHEMDDEMLCYATLFRAAKISSGTTMDTTTKDHQNDDDNDDTTTAGFTKILTEVTRFLPRNKSIQDYPSFSTAIRLLSNLSRQEYYPLLHLGTIVTSRGRQSSTTTTNSTSSSIHHHHHHHQTRQQQQQDNVLPILAKCCLAGEVSTWRYRVCQQYNVSFAKEEHVSDLSRLLNVTVTSNNNNNNNNNNVNNNNDTGNNDLSSSSTTAWWWSQDYVEQYLSLPCDVIKEDDDDVNHKTPTIITKPPPPTSSSSLSLALSKCSVQSNPAPISSSSSSFAVIFKKVAMPFTPPLPVLGTNASSSSSSSSLPPHRQDEWVFGGTCIGNTKTVMGMEEDSIRTLLQTGWVIQ